MLDNMFSSVNTLQKGLNTSWLRNEVISNNIANIDTPGFKASRVRFEEYMAEAAGTGDGLEMAVTDDAHIYASNASAIENVEPEVFTDKTTSARLDGNNVNIENEMVELAKNSIAYYTTVSKINSEFRKLDTAINIS